MSPETGSALMARIKGKNTAPELLLAKELIGYGLRWHKHAKDLPGRPDFVFRNCRVVVFVDGDFWHGWRFSVWRDKLTAKWAQKITANRLRDDRVHRSLRRSGWRVIRIWEHQLERDIQACVDRVISAVNLHPVSAQERSRTWSKATRLGIRTNYANKNPGPLRGSRRK